MFRNSALAAVALCFTLHATVSFARSSDLEERALMQKVTRHYHAVGLDRFVASLNAADVLGERRQMFVFDEGGHVLGVSEQLEPYKAGLALTDGDARFPALIRAGASGGAWISLLSGVGAAGRDDVASAFVFDLDDGLYVGVGALPE